MRPSLRGDAPCIPLDRATRPASGRWAADRNVNVQWLLAFIQETDEKDSGVIDALRPALEEAVGKPQSLKARLEALQEQRPDSRVPTVEESAGLSQDVRAAQGLPGLRVLPTRL